MNDWKTIRKHAIVEADDFQNKYDRNGLEMLFYWKTRYPAFKITLFTIPNKTSPIMLKLMGRHSDWIELAVHGWDHDSNFECWDWDYEKTKILMEGRIPGNYVNIFKAPGWMITGDEKGTGSGYPLQDHNKLAKDPQAVYRAFMDLDFIVMDRHYNRELRPDGLKCICIDCNPDIVHMHTWDMPTGDLQGKNGFRQVEELHGVPWNAHTRFSFISEAWEQDLIQPCQT